MDFSESRMAKNLLMNEDQHHHRFNSFLDIVQGKSALVFVRTRRASRQDRGRRMYRGDQS